MVRIIFCLLLIPGLAKCQDSKVPGSNKFPVVVSLNFMAISTPFRKIKNNFRNVGIRIGTELRLNKAQNMYQSVNIGYYRNRLNGDAVYVNSEFIYRPNLSQHFLPEIKIGPGLSEIFRPSAAWTPDGKGGWKKASSACRLSPQIHAGVGMHYVGISSSSLRMSPFVQYEMVGVVKYNAGVPLLPTSFLNFGSRVDFN